MNFYLVRQIFWALILSALTLFVARILLLDERAGQILYELRWFIIPIILGVLICFKLIKDLFAKQKIHWMPSWFCYWHLLWAFLISIIVGIAFGVNDYVNISAAILVLCIYYLSYLFLPTNGIKPYDRFAEGSVGINQDELDFKASSKNMGLSLLALNKHVNVAVIDGGMGEGKSSYVRMAIEQMPTKDILYTYISLTETNEANDFGQLFAKRWLETLASRYPVMTWLREIEGGLLQSIFHSKDERFWMGLFRLILAWDMPLFSTKARIWDKNLVITNDDRRKYFNVSRGVARHFLNIPEIKEDVWIIVIDELERSPIDEVFRIIEVIERFKLQGRTGLPVKLIFLLCISMKDLENYLNTFDSSCVEKAKLIKGFLFEDRRNIDILRRLPPVSNFNKREWIEKLIKSMDIEDSLKFFEDYKQMDPRNDPFKDAQALSFLRDVLEIESPRFISKCISGAEFFYHAFRTSDGVQKKESAIRLADVLALTFFHMKFRSIFDAISLNLSIAKEDIEDGKDLLRHWQIREEYKDDKEPFKLVRWIQKDIGSKEDFLPDAEIIEQIFGLSVRCYYSSMYEKTFADRMPSDKYSQNSTSDPKVLQGYLQLVDGQRKSKKTKNSEIYWQHVKDKTVLESLEYVDLIEYARWVRTVDNVLPELNLDVVKRLRLIWDNAATFQQYGIFDTLRHEGALFFCFQLLEVFEKLRKDKNALILQEAKSLLEGLLTAQNIDSGSKISVTNSFCNKYQQSEINSRLCDAFNNIADAKTRAAVKFVFDQINSRYIDGTEDIFSKEENFFYVLYQNWLGNAENQQEIEKIQGVIKRTLKNHPQAIRCFWESFPFKATWASVQGMLDDDGLHSAFLNNFGRSLFISLDDLIVVTRQANIQDEVLHRKVDWWFKCMNTEAVQDRLRVRSDRTLRSILVGEQLL